MTEYVWVSAGMMDENLVIPMDNDIRERARAAGAQYGEQNDRGQVLGRECFPNTFWWTKTARKNKELAPFFKANVYWGVNAQAADILRRHNLGQASLFEVQVLDAVGGKAVGGTYFCINFGNAKRAFEPGASPEAQEMLTMENTWFPPFVTKDWDISVSKDALAGPELWVDARLRRAFFVSRSLGDEIVAAGLNKSFSLRKCGIVDNT